VADQDYHELSRQVWEQVAPAWDRERAELWGASHAVGEWLVGALDPKPGERILELAAGTGETGFAAAKVLGDEGRLVCTDFSANMVEAARGEAERLGLGNVEPRVADAERMEFEDGSFDGVLCRWGYMLMADPEAALGETRRVLRDGGRLAFAVWAGPERNPWASLPGRALLDVTGAPPPDPDAPGIFAMKDSQRTRGLLGAAGFEPQREDEVGVEWRFDDRDDYWRFITEVAGPIAIAVNALEPDQQAALRERLEGDIEPFRSNGGYLLPGVSLTFLAT